ncbi:MAG: 4Fe-4S binding protein [Filomicrobium sp.]
MAFKIVASQCTVCGACEFECPNAAIVLKGDMYIIKPDLCTECEGHFDSAQCAEVCPVPDTCIPVEN